MKGLDMQQVLFTVLLSALSVSGFSHGAPDYSCKDPSVFHTQKLNATHEGIIMPQDMSSNPFRLATNVTKFGPGQNITVSLFTTNPNRNMKGFFIQATQARISMQDLRRRVFGTFINTTKNERPSVCQSYSRERVGGVSHTANRTLERVTVIWTAPKHTNPGNIQFLATSVLDYTTYWIDIRSAVLVPTGYPIHTDDGASSAHFTPTAAWYRWLQYLNYQNSKNTQKENSHTANAQSTQNTNVETKSVKQMNKL